MNDLFAAWPHDGPAIRVGIGAFLDGLPHELDGRPLRYVLEVRHPIASDRRSLNPLSTICRTSSRRAGALTTFFAGRP